MTKLTVTFLGTSSAAPTRERGLPAIAVQREGEVVLLDCGEGAQRAFLAKRIGLNREMSVLVTHLHGDHVIGLLGLLQTMSMAQRTRALTIVGPSRLKEWIERTQALLQFGLSFRVEFLPARPGTVVRTRGFVVKAARAKHSVEAFAYMICEKPRPGVFFPDKAAALGVPEGELWSRLQRGRPVKVGERVVAPSDVMGPARRGRRVGYSGDTRPSASLARFFAGCDILIFDSTFKRGDREKALERKHSTCTEAAEVAKAASVHALALTHFSARYAGVASLVREARRVFPDTFAARDGMTVEVPQPDS